MYRGENGEYTERGQSGSDAFYLNIKNPYSGNINDLISEHGSREAAFAYLKSQKYDGIDLYGDGTAYIPFDENQVKSVDNQGTFSSWDNNVMYSKKSSNKGLKNSSEGGTINENGEVKNDGIDKGGKVYKNGRMYNESEAEAPTTGTLSERDKRYDSRQRVSRTERRGYRNNEEGEIQRVVETEKFITISRRICDNIPYRISKEIYLKYNSDPRWDEGYDFSEMLAYDILSDENHKLRKLFPDEITEYFGPETLEHNQDSTGEYVSDEILERAKGTVIANESGNLIPIYHASPYVIKGKFIPGDVGIHFGSYSQAISLAKGKNAEKPFIKKFNVYKAYGVMRNPIDVDDDPYGWTAMQCVQALSKVGVITHEEMMSLHELSYKNPKQANTKLRNLLVKREYDGIRYINNFESASAESYIMFDDSQIIRIGTEEINIDDFADRKLYSKKSSNKGLKNGKRRGKILYEFPPYNKSKSQANEISTRWAHDDDVEEYATRFVSYHGSMYLIEKNSNADMGYRILRRFTSAEYKKLGAKYDERISRENNNQIRSKNKPENQNDQRQRYTTMLSDEYKNENGYIHGLAENKRVGRWAIEHQREGDNERGVKDRPDGRENKRYPERGGGRDSLGGRGKLSSKKSSSVKPADNNKPMPNLRSPASHVMTKYALEMKAEVVAKLDEQIKKYGAMEKGVDPARDVTVPNKTSDDKYVRMYARSAAEAELTTVNDIV